MNLSRVNLCIDAMSVMHGGSSGIVFRRNRSISSCLLITLILLSLIYTYDRQPLYAEGETEETKDLYDSSALDPEEFLRKTKECEVRYASYKREKGVVYCNATYDQFLCWPPAKGGTNISQGCPPEVPFVDPTTGEEEIIQFSGAETDFAVRYCGVDGLWLDFNKVSSATGWTDYISCFPSYVRELLENVTKSKDPGSKFTVAGWIRSIEFVGISTSLLSLTAGITIFTKFRTLMNKRTRIHLHLFCVLLMQCFITLLIYIDQESFRFMSRMQPFLWASAELFKGFSPLPGKVWSILHHAACLANNGCKVMYTLVEFFTSNSFFFMLIEGLYLYSTVNANALRPQLSYRMCVTFAYLAPVINIIAWVATAISRYGKETNNRCWFGYNLDKIYWILQGPRLTIIIINITVLMAVVKILITKMAQNRNSELERIKKAVRATIFLMPLLGITNFLSMTAAPLRNSTFQFAFWAFFAYVFRSFQGSMIVYIYCFKNAEVQEVLKNYRNAQRNAREYSVRCRTNVTETDCEILRREGEPSRLVSLVPDGSDDPDAFIRHVEQSPSFTDADVHFFQLSTIEEVALEVDSQDSKNDVEISSDIFQSQSEA